MFGALTIERDPLAAADIPAGVMTWFQVVGGFSFLGLVLWFAIGLPRLRPEDRGRIPGWLSTLFVGTSLAAAVCYVLALLAGLFALAGSGRLGQFGMGAYTTLL